MELNALDSGLLQAPRHIAIIMDGNGRWARKRGLPRTVGHRYGADAVQRTVEAAAEMKLQYLTLFAFSSENWQRPKDEVTELMGLLKKYLKKELQGLIDNNIRFRVIGDKDRFANDIVTLIEQTEEQTKANTGLNFNVALGYGARQEMINAARVLANEVKLGIRSIESIDGETFSSNLLTTGIPDPDMIIRTSGEQRLSNFMLWQAAYAELYFIDKFWPDFGKQDLMAAVEEFKQRERRYGVKVCS